MMLSGAVNRERCMALDIVYQEVELLPGETRRVHFVLAPASLRVYDEKGQRVARPGEFEVQVTSLSVQSRLLSGAVERLPFL